MFHARLSLVLVIAGSLTACKKHEAQPAATTGSSAAPAAASGCAAGQTLIEGPKICFDTPDGYVKPLKQDNAKAPTGGSFDLNYSSDGTIGGAFVATANVTYNAALASQPPWTYFEKDAADYCDAPPKIEDIAGGKGKFFTCPSKKLGGHVYSKSKTYTARNVIDCSSQSANKPAVDTVCKTLTQL